MSRPAYGVLWFAAGTSISLFTGRLTFALGVTVGMLAVVALQRGYRRSAFCLALVCPLASPVAALFLACAGLAYWIAERRRDGLELAAGAFGATLLLAVAFPEGGTEPFDGTSFSPALLAAIAVFVALPKQEKLLRTGIALYAVALTASFLIANPMGGNATRMGALLLGPLLLCALWGRQRDRWVLALLVPLLVYWQWSPVVRDLRSVDDQPSVHAQYYAPIVSYLHNQMRGDPARVEVVPTASHWESAIVPPAHIPIARGWERQLDRKLNPLFYTPTLGAAKYHRWLDRLAVRYVAVSDGPLDYAGPQRGEPDPGRPPVSAPGLPQRRLDDLRGAPLDPARAAPGAPGPARARRLLAVRAASGELPGPGPPQHLLLTLRRRRLRRRIPGRVHDGLDGARRFRRRDHDLLAAADLRARPALPERLVTALVGGLLAARSTSPGRLVVVAAYMLWRLARGAAEGSGGASLAHARDLVSVERSLHSFVELDVRAGPSTPAGPPTSPPGCTTTPTSTAASPVLLVYFAHNRSFCFVRNALLAAMAISLLGYFLPTAPPRFVPELGFSSAHSVTGNDAIRSPTPALQPYAAVPSMHVGMALIFGLSLARAQHRVC